MGKSYKLYRPGVISESNIVRRVTFEDGMAKVASGVFRALQHKELAGGQLVDILDGFQVIGPGAIDESDDHLETK